MSSTDERAGGADCGAAGFSARAKLRDGTPVCIRAIRPGDKERLRAAFHRLLPRSVYRRFLRPVSDLTAENLRYLTELDFRNHVGVALTVEHGAQERFIGVGRFVRGAEDAHVAELAITVADEYQHRGAATLLLRSLVDLARARGVRELLVIVLADNRPMLAVLEASGLPMRQTLEGNTSRVVLSIDAGQ